MTTLTVGNATVGFAVEGSGTPFLLFHGTTMDRTAWDMVRAAMPAEYEFVMVEFPGSGESSMPTSPLSVDELVAQGLAVMEHLGHERFHVGGYSLGAVVALAAAAAAPEKVRSVTSLCGWAISDERMKLTFGLWQRLIQTDTALFMRYAIADGFTAGAIAGMGAEMLEGVIALGAGAIAPGSRAHLDLDIAIDITAVLGTIASPALIIGGEQDRWVDISHSRSLAVAIAGARLEVLPAGHLVIQELAADVAGLVHAHAAGAAA